MDLNALVGLAAGIKHLTPHEASAAAKPMNLSTAGAGRSRFLESEHETSTESNNSPGRTVLPPRQLRRCLTRRAPFGHLQPVD